MMVIATRSPVESRTARYLLGAPSGPEVIAVSVAIGAVG
jgi:hypothetical protein